MIILMKILITGISGQDGIFLTKLIQKKYKEFSILGTSRSLSTSNFINRIKLDTLSPTQTIKLINVNLLNEDSANNLITDFSPDMLFNFTGPSSVYKSLKDPNIESEIIKIFDNITKSLILNKNFCNFFQASPSEMFGLNNSNNFDEMSKFFPNSPYAKGKLSNHEQVKKYYEKYEWNIHSGIMFNHESEYRKNQYLFMKIINAAISIKSKKQDYLILGSLDYYRDWSYAKEIVEGAFMITTKGKSCDYVLSSGSSSSIREVTKIIFDYFNLNYEDYVRIDSALLRENDSPKILSNPSKIYNELGWKTKLKVEDFIGIIIKNYINF